MCIRDRCGADQFFDVAGVDFAFQLVEVLVKLEQCGFQRRRVLCGEAAGGDLFIMRGDRHEALGERRALRRQGHLQAALVVLRPLAREDAFAVHVRDQARQRGHVGGGQRGEFAEAERAAFLRKRRQHPVHRQRQTFFFHDPNKQVTHPHAETGQQIGQGIR